MELGTGRAHIGDVVWDRATVELGLDTCHDVKVACL